MAKTCIRKKRVRVKGHTRKVCAKFSGTSRTSRAKKKTKCLKRGRHNKCLKRAKR